VKSGDRVLGVLYASGPAEAMCEGELRLMQGLADAAASLLLRARQEAAFRAAQTSRRLLEEEQARARQAAIEREALATVGKLTSCIAHEINGPLAFMRTNLRALGEYTQRLTLWACGGQVQLGPGETQEQIAGESRDIIRECLEGLDRITGIISMLKGLSRDRKSVV
jgi:two-component system NtrC family sensor kinase